VVAIALHHGGGNALTREDVLEGALDRAGSSSRGTGDSNYRMTLRHRRKGSRSGDLARSTTKITTPDFKEP
jgi:hypothetical protein